MARKEQEYKGLPGNGWSIAIVQYNSRLYLAKDHLLRVNASSFSENYRRFYFTDIQGIVVSQTNGRIIWSVVNAVLLGIFLLSAISVDEIWGWVVFGSLAMVFAILFIVNLLRGPTCRVLIQTRVGLEPLASLRRISLARRAIEILKTQIQAVQGDLPASDALSTMAPPPPMPGETAGGYNY